MPNKLLIVEDDLSIIELIKNYLEQEGFLVDTALDGSSALKKIKSDTYDLILLDLMLPNISGKEVLANIRRTSLTPVIIMSAKNTDVDKAVLLGMGADDYITKPFSLLELLARISANIRRFNSYSLQGAQNNSSIITLNDLEIDLNSFSVKKNGEPINLTSKEFEILKLFVQNPNKVFTKHQIYTSIWNEDYLMDNNIIIVHIQRLRKKIETNPSNPQYIKTLWGIGYKLGEF